MIPMKWPLACVMAVYPGAYGKVGVVTVQTKKELTNAPSPSCTTHSQNVNIVLSSCIITLKPFGLAGKMFR